VWLLETSGNSGIVIAKELGISDTILYRRHKEMRAKGNPAFPGKGHQMEPEEEMRRFYWPAEILRAPTC